MSLNFHHVGFACQDLDLETRRFAALSYAQEEMDFSDSIQAVQGRIPCPYDEGDYYWNYNQYLNALTAKK